jgi:predicted NUDIX family NTP pyrophosphohydrolase
MKQSAGILLFKKVNGQLLLLLVHPGGPFWKNKDLGAWSIPKGEFTKDEQALAAAIREFEEETATKLNGPFLELGIVTQKSGKIVYGFASEQDIDAAVIKSNVIEIEWPPRSGKKMMIPEIDRAAWCTVEEALQKINPAQQLFIRRLIEKL